MPQVRNALEKRYNIQVRLSDPDTCVAKGAAFYAAQLGEGIDDDKPIIPSIATKSYGLGCEDDDGTYYCSNIVLKDSKLPVTGHDSFSTKADGQKTVRLVVFENNIRGNYATAPNPANNTANASFDSIILKEVDFDLSGAKPKGYPLQVEFYLDENGLLQVSANTQDGNCKFDVLVEGVMTEAELQNSKEEMDDIKIY